MNSKDLKYQGNLFADVWEMQMRKTINGLFVPEGKEPLADTCTFVGNEPPSLDMEQLLETFTAMRTVLPPEIHVIESEFLTKTEERPRQRTWRKRLFSHPWRPWRAMGVEYVQVPDPNLYCFDAPLSLPGPVSQIVRYVVGHPSVIAKLKEGVAQGVEPAHSCPIAQQRIEDILGHASGIQQVYPLG